jgi:hypothetical protein
MTLPDRSTVVYPSHTYSELSRPYFATAGVGVQYVLWRYTAARLEVQGLIPPECLVCTAVRLSAGVSVPIGHYGTGR